MTTTSEEIQLVRFDWAIKTILRDKANFEILEGFLTALLHEDITIEQILDSESNMEENLKFNRVDLLVHDSTGRKIIVEVQNDRETYYLERLLFGTSKVIVENIYLGKDYRHVVKVISISILYFNLGVGNDYVYKGVTEFAGLHTKQSLKIRKRIQTIEPKFSYRAKNIFPEYYLINVKRFEDIIQTPLDEWIYFLKHSTVKAEFQAKNIDKAAQKLALLKMGPEERRRYENYIKSILIERDVIETARQEERLTIARSFLDLVSDDNLLAAKTGLSVAEVLKLREQVNHYPQPLPMTGEGGGGRLTNTMNTTSEEIQLVRFDWAIKTILRDKANFEILEGFLTALLHEDITIEQILDSESNMEENLKFNRVDLLVHDSKGSKIIVEVQNDRETYYLERLLFGTSKVIVENIYLGKDYRHVVKVISISILYFNLGVGNDYVYKGVTEFQGLHTKQPLKIRKRIQTIEPKFSYRAKNIFPEYYLINVKRFEDIIQTPLDEWIYFLKHSAVKAEFQAKNIDKAAQKLALLKMGPEERRRYENYIKSLVIERDIMETARLEGIEKGRLEGRQEERLILARSFLDLVSDDNLLAAKTGLSVAEVLKLREQVKVTLQ